MLKGGCHPRAAVLSSSCKASKGRNNHEPPELYHQLTPTLLTFTPTVAYLSFPSSSSTPCSQTPSHLPSRCQALRCQVQTASGTHITVVLGAPADVANAPPVLEHALRHTLVADSLSLQFRLPPVGVPLPAPRLAPEVLGGTPAVDCLVMTSVWAVHALRLLAQVGGRGSGEGGGGGESYTA